jgi:hypothetical protein
MVTPSKDGNYLIDGKPQTLGQIYWKIREAKASNKPITTVLYDEDAPGSIMQLICHVSLMDYWGVASYSRFQGQIRPSKITESKAGLFDILSRQCLESVVPQ